MAVWRDRRRADLGDLALMSRRFPPPWSVTSLTKAGSTVLRRPQRQRAGARPHLFRGGAERPSCSHPAARRALLFF